MSEKELKRARSKYEIYRTIIAGVQMFVTIITLAILVYIHFIR
jgi:hypothetical protein